MIASHPHHDGSPLYVSTLSPQIGERVRVRLRVPLDAAQPAQVWVRSNPDREAVFDQAYELGERDGWAWWQAEIVVANPRHGYRWLLISADGEVEWFNQAGFSQIEALDAEDFALTATPAPPSWLHGGVMYQIFPDRFARSAAADERPIPDWAIPAAWSDPVDPVVPGRSQQFYGGDLDGVTERLDHLSSLGVTMIYLTPFFPGASNHRYDASSFFEVDPLLGGDEALIRLVEAAHARGMKVIGDLTSNHSGDRNEWFQAAYAHPEAAESDFYYWLNDEHTEYECWLGVKSLPKFNWASAALRQRFVEGPDSVVAHWLKPPFSLDGWRVDVANMTGRLGAIDLNAEVRQLIRRTMDAINPDTILLAEFTNDASADFQGDAWQGAMTYPSFTRPLWSWLSEPSGVAWRDWDGSERTDAWFYRQPVPGIPKLDARGFVEARTRFLAGFPWRVLLGNMNPLDTHDTARFAQNAGHGLELLALGLSVTLPGLTMVFAGDEFGLTGADGESSRTPLPWERVSEPDIAKRLASYRALLELRHTHPALADGGMRMLDVGEQHVLYARESAAETLVVLALARGSAELELPRAALPPVTAGLGPSEAELVSGEGEARLECGDSAWSLRATGPVFAVWHFPGVSAP